MKRARQGIATSSGILHGPCPSAPEMQGLGVGLPSSILPAPARAPGPAPTLCTGPPVISFPSLPSPSPLGAANREMGHRQPSHGAPCLSQPLPTEPSTHSPGDLRGHNCKMRGGKPLRTPPARCARCGGSFPPPATCPLRYLPP